MKKIKNILWICFGNTARSPAALGISLWLKKTRYKEELKDVNFDSAGFFNIFKNAQPETINYLKKKGIDFSNFRGKIIDAELLEKQDLILAMETRHLKRLKRKCKSIKNIEHKAFLLREFAGETDNLEIEDPVNKTDKEFYKILEIIETAVVKSIEKIIKINKEFD